MMFLFYVMTGVRVWRWSGNLSSDQFVLAWLLCRLASIILAKDRLLTSQSRLVVVVVK